MKILLTGSSGMVGRNILEHKKISSFEVLTPSSKELNLLNYAHTEEYILNNKPDFIIHAAGRVGGIQANIASPVNFLIENIDMGRNLIMAAKKNQIKKLLNLSSSCMYPKNARNPLSEDLILKGELEVTNEGYALAKIFATRLCEYINKEDNSFKYKTAIPCNLYGRYDKFSPKHSHMLPAVIKKLHEAKQADNLQTDIWGDGTAKREFMYAGDFADFVIFALTNFSKMPQNINVGIGHDFTINQYYKIIAKVVDYKGTFVHDFSKPTGMKQKLIDNNKLKQFGWCHQVSLEEGIKKTYQYYLKEELNE